MAVAARASPPATAAAASAPAKSAPLTSPASPARLRSRAPKPPPGTQPFVRPPMGGPPASAMQMYALSVSFALGSAAALGLALVYARVGCGLNIPLLDVVCNDSYYKYLVPLMIPVTAWFAIANWVGWQYFRYS